MATDLEKLVVQLSADIKGYEKALARANGVTNKQFNAIERRARAMNKVFDTVLGSLGNTLAVAFAGTAALRGAQVLVDAATRISNALKIAGLSGEDLSKVYDELFGSAQRNGAPIEALVTLYSRASQSAKDLGVSQQELLKFTDTVAMSLRASGQSSEEAAGALLQLSQVLGNGVVQAEEYNSLIDGAQPLLQAAAAGLKEAGGSVSALTRLVKEGKVSSEAFFRAIEAGSYVLESQVAASTFTVSQRFQQLENVLIDTAGELDAATGASKRFGDTIEGLASGIQMLGSALTTIASSDLASFLGKLIEVNNTAQDLYTLLGRLPGVVKTMASINLDIVNGRKPGASMQADQIQSRIDGAFATVPSSGEVKTTAKTNRLPFKPEGKTVSLDDFKLPTKAKKTAGGGSKVDEYAREVAAIKERTASMQAAYAAQAALNPLVDDYGYSVEKAAAQQELMNAAQKAGKEITPQLAADIDAAAEAYARAGAQAEKLAESQDEVRQRAEEMREFQKDMTRGIIDGFTSGAKAVDIFADSLKKVGDKLLDMALNAAFDSNGGGGGGLLGSILSGIGSIFTGGKSADPWKGLRLANGGSVRGPGTGRSDSIPAMLSNGEYVINAKAAAKNPVLLDMINSGKRLQFFADGGPVSPPLLAPKMPDLSKLPMRNAGGGNSVTLSPVYHIDATGADQAAVTRLEAGLAKRDREFTDNVKKAVIRLQGGGFL